MIIWAKIELVNFHVFLRLFVSPLSWIKNSHNLIRNFVEFSNRKFYSVLSTKERRTWPDNSIYNSMSTVSLSVHSIFWLKFHRKLRGWEYTPLNFHRNFHLRKLILYSDIRTETVRTPVITREWKCSLEIRAKRFYRKNIGRFCVQLFIKR